MLFDGDPRRHGDEVPTDHLNRRGNVTKIHNFVLVSLLENRTPHAGQESTPQVEENVVDLLVIVQNRQGPTIYATRMETYISATAATFEAAFVTIVAPSQDIRFL